jgi:hypothetical protein
MLAAIALMLCTVVLFKMKRERYAFVTLLPTAWLVICTLTAGLQKVFDSAPSVGFLAHANIFRAAADAGKVLAPAKNLDEMRQIVLNDTIDAVMAFIFVLLVASMIYFGVRACIDAWRASGWTARELPERRTVRRSRSRRSEADETGCDDESQRRACLLRQVRMRRRATDDRRARLRNLCGTHAPHASRATGHELRRVFPGAAVGAIRRRIDARFPLLLTRAFGVQLSMVNTGVGPSFSLSRKPISRP